MLNSKKIYNIFCVYQHAWNVIRPRIDLLIDRQWLWQKLADGIKCIPRNHMDMCDIRIEVGEKGRKSIGFDGGKHITVLAGNEVQELVPTTHGGGANTPNHQQTTGCIRSFSTKLMANTLQWQKPFEGTKWLQQKRSSHL